MRGFTKRLQVRLTLTKEHNVDNEFLDDDGKIRKVDSGEVRNVYEDFDVNVEFRKSYEELKNAS